MGGKLLADIKNFHNLMGRMLHLHNEPALEQLLCITYDMPGLENIGHRILQEMLCCTERMGQISHKRVLTFTLAELVEVN